MTEQSTPWDAATVAVSDQNAAAMAALGQQWAAMYRALIEGGVPVRVAVRMLERHQATTCRMMLVGAAAQAGAR